MRSPPVPEFLRNIFSQKEKKSDNAVEAKLALLQTQHRLAMHCFEYGEKRALYPESAIADLEANANASPAELLRTGNPALFSMTLLRKPGKSILPYDNDAVSYLFDLSVGEKESPALVVRCYKGMGCTLASRFKKDLAYCNAELPGLETLYDGRTTEEFKKNVANDPSLSERQLDILGDYMDKEKSWILSLNEVVAAVKKEHIAAIAIPYHHRDMKKPFVELKGALAGLAHLKHGMDLPVVMYNIDSHDPGKCTYIAQGQEECTQVAINAIRELQAGRHAGLYLDNFKSEIRDLLGIDITQPLPQQRTEQAHVR